MISGMSRADVKNVLHFYLHNFFIMVSLFLTTYIHVWPHFPWTKKTPRLDFFKSNLSVLYLSGLISQTRKPILQIFTTLFLYYIILENTGWKSLPLIWWKFLILGGWNNHFFNDFRWIFPPKNEKAVMNFLNHYCFKQLFSGGNRTPN